VASFLESSSVEIELSEPEALGSTADPIPLTKKKSDK
jgi:hypothetical protein